MENIHLSESVGPMPGKDGTKAILPVYKIDSVHDLQRRIWEIVVAF